MESTTPVLAHCGPACPRVRTEADVTVCPCGTWVCDGHADAHAGVCPEFADLLADAEAQP